MGFVRGKGDEDDAALVDGREADRYGISASWRLAPYAGIALALSGCAPLAGGLAASYRAGDDLLATLWPLWVGWALGALTALLPQTLRACGLARAKSSGSPTLGGSIAVLVAGLFGLVLLVASVTMEGAAGVVLRLFAGVGLGSCSFALGTLWLSLRAAYDEFAGRKSALGADERIGPLGWALSGGLLCFILTGASWLGYSMAVPVATALLLLASVVLHELVAARCGGPVALGAAAAGLREVGVVAASRSAVPDGSIDMSDASDWRTSRPAAAVEVGGSAASAGLHCLLSGLLLGLVIAFMMGQFLGAKFGSPSELTWAWGVLGVVIAAASQMALRWVLGRWEPFFASWVAAVALLVAFFPIEAGSEFSLKFAVAGATLAIWCSAVILPSVVDAYARSRGYAACECHAALAGGFVLGVAFGGPTGQVVAATQLQGIVVYISAIASMVVSFLVLILVLGRPRGEGREGIDDSALGRGAAGSDGFTGTGALEEGPSDVNIEARCRALAAANSLTPREAEVLGILAHGYDLNRVQADLGISEGTALTHKRHVYQKLGVHSRADLLDLVRRS